jgi:ATP-binding cassette subfamily C protein CydCD
VALVGPSGAGKTTLAQLMMRFWDPDSGAIRMDGADLRDYRLDALRGRIALVAQDTYLFNESLRHNILIARPTASEAEVRAAVERAALADFVAALPEGLDTPVGERGMRLSGGQRQRVAIARAFLKDAPVLILDEATSHLDAVNEGLVRRALAELMHDRTTVVIAHRLSTVRNADSIVVLDQGRVVEIGNHAQLIARGGLYARLVAHQMTGGIASAAS